MNPEPTPQTAAPDQVLLTVPGSIQEFLEHLCKAKGVSREQAIATMLYFSCRLLQENPMQPGVDLFTEIDFARGVRLQTCRRADQLMTLVERLLLDSQGIQRAMRNRTINS